MDSNEAELNSYRTPCAGPAARRVPVRPLWPGPSWVFRPPLLRLSPAPARVWQRQELSARPRLSQQVFLTRPQPPRVAPLGQRAGRSELSAALSSPDSR